MVGVEVEVEVEVGGGRGLEWEGGIWFSPRYMHQAASMKVTLVT